MSAEPAPTPPTLACHRCNYDLRAHDPAAVCPECGTSVAESARVAAVPVRPAWRDSDPRWRRRVLAGLWLLLLMPLGHLLVGTGWAEAVPVWPVYGGDDERTLRNTLLLGINLFYVLAFCVGVALVLARERGRRASRWDLAATVGVGGAWSVFIIQIANVLLLCGLVAAGMVGVFHSMPLRFEPPQTPVLRVFATSILWYGPTPGRGSWVVVIAAASIAVLAACLRVYQALRSTLPQGARWRRVIVAILPSVLALFALVILFDLARYLLFSNSPPAIARFGPSDDIFLYDCYFRPGEIASFAIDPGRYLDLNTPGKATMVIELLKWTTVLAIALWLTLAQFLSYRKPRRVSGPGREGT